MSIMYVRCESGLGHKLFAHMEIRLDAGLHCSFINWEASPLSCDRHLGPVGFCDLAEPN
jgi:hypothetical protein